MYLSLLTAERFPAAGGLRTGRLLANDFSFLPIRVAPHSGAMNNRVRIPTYTGTAFVTRNDGAPGSPVEVLIVDDNEDAAMSLLMLFELEDIAAAAAPDAPGALALVQEATPQLMLIDIGLPGMNGFQLAQRLREQPATRRMTLIALTGRDASGEDPDAAAFDQFWTKPFDPKKLLAEVKSILERSATQP